MTTNNKKTYVYEGPVYRFETIVNNKWKGNTTAVSPKQALNNLTHRYRMSAGLEKNTKVSLDGKYLKSL